LAFRRFGDKNAEIRALTAYGRLWDTMGQS
jgi:hypothetical protein